MASFLWNAPLRSLDGALEWQPKGQVAASGRSRTNSMRALEKTLETERLSVSLEGFLEAATWRITPEREA